MIYDILHCFGAGIAFAIGVFCGATLMMWCAITYRQKELERNVEQSKRCEDRLEGYVENTGRIANCLLRMEEMQREAMNRK